MSTRKRSRPLTNRTPLQVISANDLDPSAVDYVAEAEEENSGRLVNGVEFAEATEHHLQAALSNHDLLLHREKEKSRSTGTSSSSSSSFAQAAAKPATAPLPAYHIPTPNASKLDLTFVDKRKWTTPTEYIKFSEKVEETSLGWGGLGYEMDERDENWLKSFNEREQGSSGTSGSSGKDAHTANGNLNGSSNGNPDGSGRISRNKGKDKEKEPKENAPLRIQECEFEYIMGMFEYWTEKNVLVLHTDLALMPTFSAIESIFSHTPPASYFPSYEVPRDLPAPAAITRMARNVFPHWKERKEIRKGRPIIAQLNLDEANENDPYLCFRRRENKPPRKTRNKDTTSVDRMQKVQFELRQAQSLVGLVLAREREKRIAARSDKELWEARLALLDVKRKYPQLSVSAEEEALLFPERTAIFPSVPRTSISGPPPAKKQRLQYAADKDKEDATAQRTIVVQASANPRITRSRAQSPSAEKVPPEQLAGLYADKVEREMKRKREMDRYWEDSTNASYQPLPQPAAMKFFRSIPPTDVSAPPRSFRDQDGDTSDESADTPIIPSNHQMCFRLRRGRGGTFRLDRKMPSVHRYRRGSSGADLAEQALPHDALMFPLTEGVDSDPAIRDRARLLSERWRYDGITGKVALNMGVSDEEQVVIDDFEPKYIKLRASIITPDDMDAMTPTTSALDRVQQILALPPDPPPLVELTSVRNLPLIGPPPMSAQVAQQQLLAQQQQLLVQSQMAGRQLPNMQGMPNHMMQAQAAQMVAQQMAANRPMQSMQGLPAHMLQVQAQMIQQQQAAQQQQQQQQHQQQAQQQVHQHLQQQPQQQPQQQLQQGQQQLQQQAQQIQQQHPQQQQQQQPMQSGLPDMRLQNGTAVNGMASPGIVTVNAGQGQAQLRRAPSANMVGQMGPPPLRQNNSPAPMGQNFVGSRLPNGSIVTPAMIANMQRAGQQQPVSQQNSMQQVANAGMSAEAMRSLAQIAAAGNGVTPEVIAAFMVQQQNRNNAAPMHSNYQMPNGLPHSSQSASPVSANGMQQSPRMTPAQPPMQLPNGQFPIANGGGYAIDQLAKMVPQMTPQQLKLLQRQPMQPGGGQLPMGMASGVQPLPMAQQQGQQQMNLHLKMPNGRLAQLAQAGHPGNMGPGTVGGSPQMSAAMPVGGPSA